ncbi:MAG: helix-turn-helix domain-containing protein [Catenulispora sp.]|nr:helix-turn-helix domain-containing protein [Catenulispora sp.]
MKSSQASVMTQWDGGVRIATEASGPGTIVHGAEDVAAGSRTHILARLQTEGEVRLSQDGRSALVPVGSLVLYDTARPFKLASSAQQKAHVLAMPRAVLRLDESTLRNVTATVIAGDGDVPLAALTALAVRLVEELAATDPALREYSARAAADAIGCAVTQYVSCCMEARQPRQLLWERITAAIQDRLGDPDLTPQAIADHHHISVRYLQVLFQQQGTTVNAWVRSRRLEAAGRDLARPDAQRRSVAAVAAKWGFTNTSHFSRAFREAFGTSPMKWRTANSPQAVR